MNLTNDSLVLYKTHPARVLSVGEKIEIELENGQTKRVRSKDIEILHPGPIKHLNELTPQTGEIEEAWSILEGNDTNLKELTELIYSQFTPATAWATWQLIIDGLLFTGTIDTITAHSRAKVEQDRKERNDKDIARREWAEFITRLRAFSVLPEDRERLQEVEKVALGQTENSRILEALEIKATKENAHRFLIEINYWHPTYNPYPLRCNINLTPPHFSVPNLPLETRRDLTHLESYAIDNEGNQDPDDAISLDGNTLWVHIADVAALVSPDDQLDQEARIRGSNLYIPESVTPILPWSITHTLGLGLQTPSPALSFGISIDDTGNSQLEICSSWVHVQRISYQVAETRLDRTPFNLLLQITDKFRERRKTQGASFIELPEVELKLVDGVLRIRPQERLRSRDLVADAMLMAGEAVAIYCHRYNIPIPYVTQSPPENPQHPTDLAGMWTYRRQFKPSRLSTELAAHAGLGLTAYTRVTSPLRRYSDLLVHQQLRAHLAGNELINNEQMASRVDVAELNSINVRKAERLSNHHWKMIWLKQHPEWKGKAVVMEREQERLTVIIPELALETKVRLQGGNANLNDRVLLKLREVDLAELTAYFATKLIH
jgi:exoribonuclease-2